MPQPEWNLLALEAIRWRRAKQPLRAIECLTRSIEITRQLPDLVGETGTNLNYLADVYLEEGMLAQAEDTIRQAIQYRLRLPASERILAADDLMILAKVLSKQGRHREALEAGSQALNLFQQQHGAGGFVRQIKASVKQLRENLAQAESRESRSVPTPLP